MYQHRSGNHPPVQQKPLDQEDVLAKLKELMQHGYGKLEVQVRDHQVTLINWGKTVVAEK